MPTYPLSVNHFQVEWGGQRIGFMEVRGLAFAMDVIETRDGASPENSTIKMPGMIKNENIILKRAVLSSDNSFYKWFNTVRLNTIERRDIIISLLNEEHEPVVVWKIKNAFPKRIDYSPLDATSHAPLMEIIELVHEGMTIQYNN